MGKPYFETVHEMDDDKAFILCVDNEIRERTIDKNGQYLFITEVEVATYWKNLEDSDYEVIRLYHVHEEYEQYHSEIKTDIDLERLLSGKLQQKCPCTGTRFDRIQYPADD